jgi:molybdopterin-guanine dinucleotide biosynthesis protein A
VRSTALEPLVEGNSLDYSNKLDISCIVLAGGRGSRLGENKAWLTVGEKSLFQWVLYGISFLKGEVIIVTSGKESFPGLSAYPRHKIVSDIYTGRGPLGGIFTGLTVSKSLYNLVVACDMPFLNQALLTYMIQLADGFDVVIPRLDDMVEPLHAVYSKSCLAPMEHMIKQGNLSVNQLLSLITARYVEADEIDRFDAKHLSFFNVNTKADLETAQELVRNIINDKR